MKWDPKMFRTQTPEENDGLTMLVHALETQYGIVLAQSDLGDGRALKDMRDVLNHWPGVVKPVIKSYRVPFSVVQQYPVQ